MKVVDYQYGAQRIASPSSDLLEYADDWGGAPEQIRAQHATRFRSRRVRGMEIHPQTCAVAVSTT
jgi:hypothetical protein